MKTDDLVEVFQGLLRGIGPTMRQQDREEIGSLVELFRRFPGQSVTDFVGEVDGAIGQKQPSEPPLIDRLRHAIANKTSDRETLFIRVQSLPAAELRQIVVALGYTAGKTKADNLRTVARQLRGETSTESVSQPQTDADTEKLYQEYQAIKSQLEGIDFDSIRTRCAVFSAYSKSTIGAVLIRLGYPKYDTKSEMLSMLQDNLISLKLSLELTKRI